MIKTTAGEFESTSPFLSRKSLYGKGETDADSNPEVALDSSSVRAESRNSSRPRIKLDSFSFSYQT
jgi:hypothetical protein